MSDALLLPLLAVFGLAVGSFLNVVIVRVPSGESVVRPPSRCPLCRTELRSRDNIPVLSWILLRGRCRSCGEPIPVGYPLVEVANAALWVAAGLRFGASWEVVPFALFFSVLLALSVIDLELYILPNAITYPAALVSVVAVVVLALVSSEHPGTTIIGALISGIGYPLALGFVLIAFELIVRKEGMGMGDVKLAPTLGLWVGYVDPLLVPVSVFAASVVGLVVGAGILVVRRASKPYPFGPWLAVGAVAVILASGPVLDWVVRDEPLAARGSSALQVDR
ncbi:MAG TPA: prepilin peptidase [Aquihabitans sp.]|jgi:leader peptidase (prepilin peptidase)/N-methyltransferase|nr:prepilin peptidase [Aquihabitans sp.]